MLIFMVKNNPVGASAALKKRGIQGATFASTTGQFTRFVCPDTIGNGERLFKWLEEPPLVAPYPPNTLLYYSYYCGRANGNTRKETPAPVHGSTPVISIPVQTGDDCP